VQDKIVRELARGCLWKGIRRAIRIQQQIGRVSQTAEKLLWAWEGKAGAKDYYGEGEVLEEDREVTGGAWYTVRRRKKSRRVGVLKSQGLVH
jgi:hypothetical protein